MILFWPLLFVSVSSVWNYETNVRTESALARLPTTATTFPGEVTSDREHLTTEEKNKRLKSLRTEVRRLSAQLRKEQKPLKSQKIRKWRRRMRERIESVRKRVRTLERKHVKAATKARKGESKPSMNKTNKSNRGRTTKLTTSHPNSSSSRPRLINSTDRCQTHNDCRPGFCCHRWRSETEHARCVKYAQGEGDSCAHSCACASQLLCFRDVSTAAPSPAELLDGSTAKCKRVPAGYYRDSTPQKSQSIFFSSEPPEKLRGNTMKSASKTR